VAAALSNIYHVPEDRTASRNATTFAFLILYDGLDNELKEFWPDIRRKVFHKNTPQFIATYGQQHLLRSIGALVCNSGTAAKL